MRDTTEKKLWFTYVDYTSEPEPRPFYVGKGDASRVARLNRNKHHRNISKRYGVERRVVFCSRDEAATLDLECELIVEYKTCVLYEDSWGANYTVGGNGVSGFRHSLETKKRSAASRKKYLDALKANGIPHYNTGNDYGKYRKKFEVSAETKLKLSLAKKGKPSPTLGRKFGKCKPKVRHMDPAELRAKLSTQRIGRKLSEAAKQKLSLANKGRPKRPEELANIRKGVVKRDINRKLSKSASFIWQQLARAIADQEAL